jgi:hypothetical protein
MFWDNDQTSTSFASVRHIIESTGIGDDPLDRAVADVAFVPEATFSRAASALPRNPRRPVSRSPVIGSRLCGALDPYLGEFLGLKNFRALQWRNSVAQRSMRPTNASALGTWHASRWMIWANPGATSCGRQGLNPEQMRAGAGAGKPDNDRRTVSADAGAPDSSYIKAISAECGRSA